MKPPGIGEALGKGFEAFKANAVPLIIGAILVMVPLLGLVTFGGFAYMCLKAIRGQKPEIGDAFIAFKSGLIDHIVALIVQALCCIITGPLFHRSTYYIADKNMKFGEALSKSMADTKPALVAWIIFWFVCSLVGGLCACITMPIGGCAIAYAYEKATSGGGEAK